MIRRTISLPLARTVLLMLACWAVPAMVSRAAEKPNVVVDLKSDPREETNLATKHPDVVKQMATQHAAWKQTLAPLGEIPKLRGGEPIIPTGHGWALASGQNEGAAK